MKKFDVFFLPYAGGNKYSYREYEEKAPPFLHLIPLEYPGRGERVNEPLLTTFDAIVNDLYHQIKSRITHEPYAIYGHSMGALGAYLLTRKLITNKHTPPLHIFVTGTIGPSALTRREKKRHLLGKDEFIEEIKSLKGISDEILENEELMNYFEPILRADFTAVETYLHQEADPMDVPITVITGMEEDMEPEEIKLWQNETKHPVDFRRFPGSHFFIFNYIREVLEIISRKLLTRNKMHQL